MRVRGKSAASMHRAMLALRTEEVMRDALGKSNFCHEVPATLATDPGMCCVDRSNL